MSRIPVARFVEQMLVKVKLNTRTAGRMKRGKFTILRPARDNATNPAAPYQSLNINPFTSMIEIYVDDNNYW